MGGEVGVGRGCGNREGMGLVRSGYMAWVLGGAWVDGWAVRLCLRETSLVQGCCRLSQACRPRQPLAAPVALAWP